MPDSPQTVHKRLLVGKRGIQAEVVSLEFFGYLAAMNPRTRFLVYSRGRVWPDAAAEAAWIRELLRSRVQEILGRR